MNSCPVDEELRFAVWVRTWTYTGSEWQVTSDPEWQPGEPRTECRAFPEDQLNNTTVRQAVEEFGLPAARLEMNPVNGRTLVHFDSIFYTEIGPTEFGLDVGGTGVQIRATPVAYHWDFGDEQATTDHPGKPYAEDRDRDEYVIHVYERTGSYDTSVDVDYEVEWNAGGGWTTIPEPIPGAPGPVVQIEVLEKTSVLRAR